MRNQKAIQARLEKVGWNEASSGKCARVFSALHSSNLP